MSMLLPVFRGALIAVAAAMVLAAFRQRLRRPARHRSRTMEPPSARALIASLRRPMLRLVPSEAETFSKLGGAPEMPQDLQ